MIIKQGDKQVVWHHSDLVGIKGTDHDFCWSGKNIYHLQKQGNIHIFQNKYQNPHKFAEIMKKNRVFLASFFLEGTLTVFFNFLKF